MAVAAVDAVRVSSGVGEAAVEGVKKPATTLVETGASGAKLAFRSWKFGNIGEGTWRAFRLESNWAVDMFLRS